jgi:hypothetical protein
MFLVIEGMDLGSSISFYQIHTHKYYCKFTHILPILWRYFSITPQIVSLHLTNER